MRNKTLMFDTFIRRARLYALGIGLVVLLPLSSAAQTTEPSPRVYSKDKPLFDRSVPEVTPGQGGETRAIVVPQRPDRKDEAASSAANSAKPRSQDSKTKAGDGDAVSDTAATAKSVSPAPEPRPAKRASRESGSADATAKSPYEPKSGKNSKAAEKPKQTKKTTTAEKNTEAGTSEVEIINSSRPAPARAAKRDDPAPSSDVEVHDQEPAIADLPTKKPPVPLASRKATPRKRAARQPRRSRRTRSDTWDRYARQADDYPPRRRLRRRYGAPPGTYDSFVRCRPDGRCTEYYRVRRPRTEREYRRLRAWQYDRRPRRYRYRRPRDFY